MKQFSYVIFLNFIQKQCAIIWLFLVVGFAPLSLLAQPANDDCAGVIDLGEAVICPSPDIYNNIGASMSEVFTNTSDNIPGCFVGNADRDVWFSFSTPPVGGIIDFEVLITGVSELNPSIENPQVAIYRGDCALDGLAELACVSAEAGATAVELEILGLTPSTVYFLRINDWSSSGTPNWGDFEICIQEYEENEPDEETPEDLPWATDPGCGTIVTKGIAAVSCGVGSAVPDEDQWVFGLMNMNGVMPNSERVDVSNEVEMYHHPSWHIDSIGNVFGITMDYNGNIYAAASANYSSEFYTEPSILKYGAIGGGENDIQAAGTIYKMSGISGQASVFAVLPQQSETILHSSCEGYLDMVRVTGPGLGNLTYSQSTQQFYATNIEDGRIYRINEDGVILDSYDPLSLDNGSTGTVSLEEIIYGIDISPDGSQLFFGNSFSFLSKFGGESSFAKVYSIDLNPDGSFIGAIDNSAMPSGASWDNYVGDEILHYEVNAPTFSFIPSQLIISDLEFTPDGKLLVGCRAICQNNIHSSYNHTGRTFVLSLSTSSGLYSNEDGIIYSGNPFSLGQSNEAYGGVSSFIDEDGSIIYATSSADMLEEEGPHGIHLSNAGSYGSLNNPTSPAGIIAYSSDPLLEDPKGVGGDIKFFVACEMIIEEECSLESVDAGENMVICGPGEEITLNGSVIGEFTNVVWTPSEGLSDPNSLTPTVFIETSTTYTMTAQGTIDNVIINGDFDDGSTGFTSEYVVGNPNASCPLCPEGTYAVTSNSSFVHFNFAACTDNTGGGNMMVINGATVPNEEIWCQTVEVSPNTDYEFSTWVTSVISANPAILQFSINGNLLGAPFNVSSTICDWNQFFEVWNSGNNTSAEICITNQNTIASGNDFAIDDISFSPVCFLEDELTITVLHPIAEVVPNEILTCFDSVISLDGTASTMGDDVSYEWTTNNGNIVDGETTLMPLVDAAGIYMLIVTQEDGTTFCSDTAEVFVTQEDIELVLPDSIFLCQGETFTFEVSGFETYEWTPTEFLSCSDCPNPTVTATESITYTLTATTEDSCVATASTNIIVFPSTSAEVSLASCQGSTINYEGTELEPGSITEFAFTDQNGCDSIVVVTVDTLPNFSRTLNLEACEGTTVTYEGTELQASSTTDFTFTAQNGCDSVVTVIVEELENFASTLNLEACDGTTVNYEGTELLPGSTTIFNFTAQNGCDSIVTVIVEELSNFASTLNLEACEGTTITYEETELLPGSTTIFNFIAQNGCDSIVTVNIETLSDIETSETITICPEDMVDIFGNTTNIPGIYDSIFVAANGCDSTHTITLELFESPQISSITSTSVSCFEGSDGTASVEVEGGSSPYTYLWSNNDETANIENQAAGTYSVTITDANGCIVSSSITIDQPTDLLIAIDAQNVGCDEPGFAIASTSGGSPPYSFTWNNGIGVAENLDILTGTYTVTATDANGCAETATVEISGGFGPVIEIIIDARPSQADPNGGALSLNIENGTPPFNFEWSNGETTESITGISSGEYSATITDANGCTNEASVQIFEFSCLGGVVWNDLNRDGCQSFGEIDIPNIQLNISGTDIFNNIVEANVTTDANGTYLFDSLTAGNYTIEVIPYNGYQLSIPNNCNDDDLDSDFNVLQRSIQVTLLEGDCPKNIDAGIFDECLNILDPGAICCNQVLCGPGNIPDPITSLELPSGGEGPIEYMWLQGTAQGISGSIFYTGIPNSNSPDYAPGPLTETTYYARCARTAGCGKWLETTFVKITVEDVAVAAISAPNYVCVGDVTVFTAPDNDPDALYFWDFGSQASPTQSNDKTVVVTWSNVGLTKVTLTVMHDGCTSTDAQQIVVSNTAALCPNFLGTDQLDVEADAQQMKAEARFNLFPNPVRGELNINWDANVEGIISFSLISVNGTQIQSSRMDGANLSHRLFVEDIPTGVYILQIRQENGSVTNLKVVKN